MSNYTSQLRYICEVQSGFTPAELNEKTIDEIITAAQPKIFNFRYPIYDEAYRNVLEHEILFHFYMREIGAETYGLFNYYLARKMREIMPYYNQLYKSAALEFNPLNDVDYTEEHHGSQGGEKNTVNSGNSSSTMNVESSQNTVADNNINRNNTENQNITDNGKATNTATTTATTTENTSRNTNAESNISGIDTDAYSDTPQTSVSGVNGINDNYYLTNYRKKSNNTANNSESRENGTNTAETTSNNTSNGTNENKRNSSTTQDLSEENHGETYGNATSRTENTGRTTGNETENFNNTDEYINHVIGKRNSATFSAMLLEFRETIININKMIFDELEVCFMNIY